MKTKSILLLLAISLITSIGCKRKGCTDDHASNYDAKSKTDDGSCEYPEAEVHFNIEHKVGADDITLNSVQYTAEAGNKYSVEHLEYFISDITIHQEGGDDIVIDAAHYIDLEDATTHQISTGKMLEPGTYSGISFTFGLDTSKNVNGAFPNAPESNMFWPAAMGGGYHFMKLEGKYDSLATGNIKNYAVHMGAADMMSMNYDSHFTVTFNNSFTIKGATEVEIHALFDINEWFENPETYDFNNYDDGTMMNMMAQAKLVKNGANVFSIEEIHSH